MIITKGILNRKYEIKPKNLLGGLLLWIISAYILYAFFQLYREAFRLFTGQFGDSALLVLTPAENYIYNLFCAAIASALGYSIALRFLLQNSLDRPNWQTLSLARRTLNNEGFWTWSFLLWFGKLGSILGTWYMISAMQYDLDLIREFAVMLVLLPLVLFYSSWPSFSRLVRADKTIWFTGVSFVFIVMSFGFAFKNFTDYKKINNSALSRSIEYVFELKRPNSQSQQRIIRRSLVTDIYIVRDTIEKEIPAIFFGNIDNRVDFHDIRKAVAQEKGKVSSWEQRQLLANLHIDERISMRYINPIIDELRKADLQKVQYSTGRKYSRYPSDYPAFKNSGIQKWLLPQYYAEFEDFLDSAERINWTGKTIKLSESLMYRNGSEKNLNRIEINLTRNSVTLNGEKIDSFNLERKVYGFIKKYSPNYLIIFNSDNEITYGRYIEYLDLLWTQVDRLRNNLSLERYNQPFENWYRHPELDTIIRQFPRNILEWSKEEQRLNELLKKAGNKL